MVRNISNVSFEFNTDSLSIPTSVRLENDEAQMYSLLFNKEVGAPIEVKEPLQECLREFVESRLLEKNYCNFIELCHQATKKNFDSVEKDGLQVINNETDASLICADKKGEWEVVCTLEKGIISKFYKHKNFGGSRIIRTTTTGTNITRGSSNSISMSVPEGFKQIIEEDS